MALIFVGITLALFFDNWNEARKDRILEEQLFAALRADLLETRADLVTDIETAEKNAKNTRKLIEVVVSDVSPENAGKDISWREIGTSRLFQKNFAYRALVAQGLDSITNWQLLKEVTDFYELQLSRVDFIERESYSAESRVLEQLYPHMGVPEEALAYLRSNPGTGPFLQEVPREIIDWEAMHEDQQLVHWLMELLQTTHGALAFYRRALAQLDEIVGMIDEEIGSPG